MAEQREDAAEGTTIDPAAESSGGRSVLLSRLLIGAGLAAVVLGECMLAYVFLPSAEETAALAGAVIGEDEAARAERERTKPPDEIANQVEVDLGTFKITAFQPVSNSTLLIDFHVFATVNAEDQEEFQALMLGNENRFREQVIVTIRAASIEDFTDAGLGLLKNQILEKTNRLLGKPILQTIIFSEFSFIDQ